MNPMQSRPWLIDAHLDLAYNALEGRDPTLPLAEYRAADPMAARQRATTTLDELRLASVRLCFGTIFTMPHGKSSMSDATIAGYTDHAGARAQATANLDVYHRWEDRGLIRLLKTRQEVTDHLDSWTPDAPLGLTLLMEGADPIRDADDLPFWVEQGVRMIGLAWQKTRFAGGTATPGPLSEAGKELVTAMKDLGLTVDASHLDDAAFWDTVDIGPQLIASHSNSRTLVDGNRHLTDDMVKAIAATDGMIGLVFCNSFINRSWKRGEPRPTMTDLLGHAQHYADLIGWNRVGLGTDMDGGFGVEGSPDPIESYRDVPRFLDVIPAEHREAVAHGNWERWLRERF